MKTTIQKSKLLIALFMVVAMVFCLGVFTGCTPDEPQDTTGSSVVEDTTATTPDVPEIPVETPTYTVTIQKNNEKAGSVAFDGDGTDTTSTFEENSVITIKATTNTGFAFTGWYVDDVLVSTNTEYTYTVDKSQTVTAKFEVTAHEHIPGEAATCVTPQTCTICDVVLAETVSHDYDAVVVAPTCTKRGYTNHTCAVCGHKYTDSTVESLGHSAGAEATCTTSQDCTVCGIILVEALGHNYEAVVTAPTCTEAGYTTHTCSRCADVYTDTPVNALGHTPGTAATCTTSQYCTVCEVVLVEAFGHNYEAVVTAPTCTEAGYTTHTCANCGDKYTDTPVEALGHTEGPVATCTTSQDCTVCGIVLVEAYGHTEGPAATCTTAQNCTVCEVVLVEALGHKHTSVVTNPTATADGYTTNTCTVCEHVCVSDYVTPNAFVVTIENRDQIGYTGAEGEYLVIPAVFERDGEWYRVIAIESEAFKGCTNLVGVSIPSSVTTIGAHAFSDCVNLADVKFEEKSNLTSIGYAAFSGCVSLTVIELPVSVESIGQSAFSGCPNLTIVNGAPIDKPMTDSELIDFIIGVITDILNSLMK